MGEIIKERNYRYDALRGICMFLIVLQHFTFKGGYEFTGNAGNLIYVGIDIFVMQAFFFRCFHPGILKSTCKRPHYSIPVFKTQDGGSISQICFYIL